MSPSSADHYSTLGVSPSASAAEIRAAYRRLALDSHPDRPGGDASRFRDLGRAYSTLSDPGKRAEYDARRNSGNGTASFGGDADESDGVVEVDLSSLGVVDAALLSVFGKLGVSIRAAPPPAVLEAARNGSVPDSETQRLAWVNGVDDGDPLLRPLPTSTVASSPVLPPLAVAGSVARGQAEWYILKVPESARSYAIAAHSRAGSKLKLLLFEPGGSGGGGFELAASADSVPFVSSSSPSNAEGAAERATTTTNNGQLALLVASESFHTLELRPPGTAASIAAARGGVETPPNSADASACGGAFRRLDGLSARELVSPAPPGTEILIAVVGANTFRKSSYSIRAVLLERREEGKKKSGSDTSDDDDESERNSTASAAAAATASLRSTEEALLASRRELSELEAKHRSARLALEAVAAEAAAASARVEALLRSRDEAYARVLGMDSSVSSASVRSGSAGGELP